MPDKALTDQLAQIAHSLAVLSNKAQPPREPKVELDASASHAFVWQPEHRYLRPVKQVARVPLELIIGVDRVRDILADNTARFAQGLPANNALLWGARGTGKSSIVKALHAHVDKSHPLLLIEAQREDIDSLELLLDALRVREERFLLFVDDLSFDHDDASYKSLKAVLDGGLLGRPENVLFYATSNRRHLMPRDMIENERASGVMPGEAVEEKLSLSDRFGLWLGFHRCDQATYLKMVDSYVAHFGLNTDENLHPQAKEWATTRGSRSGRVAWQFIQDLAGKQGRKISF